MIINFKFNKNILNRLIIMYSQRPVQPFVSKFTTTPVRTLRQNKENRPTLTMVNSPSTSMSPFRYSNTKKLKHDYSTGNYYQK